MFWIKIASPAYQGKGSYKLLLQFLRHTEKGFLFWLLKIPRLYLINIRPLWRSSDDIKCCSDGQRSGKTCRRRIIKWGQKKRMCNGLRRVEKVKMILIKSKANDINDDVADDNDDIFLRHWWLWPPCCRRTLQVQSPLAEKGSRRTGLDLDAGDHSQHQHQMSHLGWIAVLDPCHFSPDLYGPVAKSSSQAQQSSSLMMMLKSFCLWLGSLIKCIKWQELQRAYEMLLALTLSFHIILEAVNTLHW